MWKTYQLQFFSLFKELLGQVKVNSYELLVTFQSNILFFISILIAHML